MPITITIECDGCGAKVPGGAIRYEFRSFSGRAYGFGSVHQVVEMKVPDGWVVPDPYTYASYCPDCWAEIQKPERKEAKS